MRKFLFKKAKWLIENNHVSLVNETDYSIRLKVKDYEVVVKYQNSEFIWLCTCRAGSLNKTCSHILAAMTYLTK